ncbi:MAG: hypothetical protein Fur009_2880 [Candidatus Microgenomates bacterium]
MKKIDYLILTFILFIALIFRLYKINTPLTDFHSWRQADTAAVARNFVRDGFDLLHPRYDDLSSNQSAVGLENPNGWRMVEFPIYNAIFAFLYKSFPQLSLVVWGRLTTIFFSLILISIIYYLAIKETNRIVAIISSFVYAIFPFFVFFSRVILPETTALSFSFISIFFLYLSFIKSTDQKNIKKTKNNIKTNYFLYFLSIIFMSSSLLVKPTVIYYLFPVFIIFFVNFKYQLIKKPIFYLYFLAIFLPFILWRQYIKNYPEGIPPSDWLFTSVNTYEGLKNIFFRPAFFRWIFFERINNIILGGYLTFFLLLGILTKPKKILLHSILISGFLYLFTFQGGNVQHEYYQTIILPAIALGVGLGVNTLIINHNIFISRFINLSIIIFLFLISFFFSYYKVKDYYNYPQELPQIASIINNLTNPDDKIITDRMGDTTLLYLSDRKGAPSIYKDPESLKKIGYKYLITSNNNEIEKLKNVYQIIFENDKFTIFKL